MIQIPCALAALSLFSAVSFACEPVVGSALIARAIDDASTGVVIIYKGAGPIVGPGELTDWSFYDANSPQNAVTPLIFEVQGSNIVLVGVGTTRFSLATGIQSFAYEPIAGISHLSDGVSYRFGFTSRSVAPDNGPNGVVTLAGAFGAVDFTGYTEFSDPWDYATPVLIGIGQVYGPGHEPINAFGFNGRIYSAQFHISCEATCPADLTGDGVLNFFDISAFLSAFSAMNPIADLTNDGVFNFFDVSAFLAAFAAGCP